MKNDLQKPVSNSSSAIAPTDAKSNLEVKPEVSPEVKPEVSGSEIAIARTEAGGVDISKLPQASGLSLPSINAVLQELETEAEKGDDALIEYVCELYDRRDYLLSTLKTAILAKQAADQAGFLDLMRQTSAADANFYQQIREGGSAFFRRSDDRRAADPRWQRILSTANQPV